jgi:hypothetical protein
VQDVVLGGGQHVNWWLLNFNTLAPEFRVLHV